MSPEYVCLSVCPSVCLFALSRLNRLTYNLHNYRPSSFLDQGDKVHGCVHPSVCPFVRPSICLSVHLSVCALTAELYTVFVCLSVCQFVFYCIQSGQFSYLPIHLACSGQLRNYREFLSKRWQLHVAKKLSVCL